MITVMAMIVEMNDDGNDGDGDCEDD